MRLEMEDVDFDARLVQGNPTSFGEFKVEEGRDLSNFSVRGRRESEIRIPWQRPNCHGRWKVAAMGYEV